jgi:hypothetical protein
MATSRNGSVGQRRLLTAIAVAAMMVGGCDSAEDRSDAGDARRDGPSDVAAVGSAEVRLDSPPAEAGTGIDGLDAGADATPDAPADGPPDAPADPLAADGPADGAADSADAGVDASCGNPGQPCCGQSTCHGGSCCYPSLTERLPFCVAPGGSCGEFFFRGTCQGGSCVREGVRCGSLGEPCCTQYDPLSPSPFRGCTGSRTICTLPPGDRTCVPCGAAGQPCCFYVNAEPDACEVGTICSTHIGSGTCLPCGGAGQPCCHFAHQRCGSGLGCTVVRDGLGRVLSYTCLAPDAGAP